MSTETKVAGHYGRGQLEELILAAVAREGKDPENLAAGDLAAVDEFHVGGLEATEELAKHMELRAGLRVLDVGSGLGGPARYFAGEHGCRVTGIDLTEEFVRVAGSLTRRTKLDGLVEFRQGSALQLPFERHTFDRAYMGARLLSHLRELANGPVLIGTWAHAVWAIRFYERHGFQLVGTQEKNRLLKTYWTVPERQIETSVVLADAKWRGTQR